MSEDNVLTLSPGKYGRLEVVHGNVTRERFVAVGGDVRTADNGQAIRFGPVYVKARRVGNAYTFAKTN